MSCLNAGDVLLSFKSGLGLAGVDVAGGGAGKGTSGPSPMSNVASSSSVGGADVVAGGGKVTS